MKTIRLSTIALLAFSALFFSACKKDKNKEEEKKEPTKSELLQANIWMITSVKTGGFEIISFLEECQKDNTVDFKPNDVLVLDEGELKCDDNDPQTSEGEWKLINDSKLYLSFELLGNPYSDTAKLVSVSNSKLVIRAKLDNMDSDVTFTKK